MKELGGDDLPSLDTHILAKSKACFAFSGIPRRIRRPRLQALVSPRAG
jgi:hypothetical protein